MKRVQSSDALACEANVISGVQSRFGIGGKVKFCCGQASPKFVAYNSSKEQRRSISPSELRNAIHSQAWSLTQEVGVEDGGNGGPRLEVGHKESPRTCPSHPSKLPQTLHIRD